MSKSRYFISILSMLLLLIALTSCKPAKITEGDILEDLNATSLVNLVIDDVGYAININKVVIDKRQSEDKVDIVYASIYQDDLDFEIESKVKINYSYYDKGGWIIDDYVVESGPTVKVKHGINKSVPDLYVATNYSVSAFIESKFDVNKQQDILTYSYSGNSRTSQYEGRIDLTYNFTYKWELEKTVEYDLSINFSPLGTWQFSRISDKYSTWRITITEFDSINKQITYHYAKYKHNIYTGNYDEVSRSDRNLVLNYTLTNGLITFEPLKYTDDKYLGGTKKELMLFIDKWNFYQDDQYLTSPELAVFIP